MKNFPKAGLLIVTLVIPALIFLFLKLFATNHYEVPYFNPKLGSDGRVEIVNGDTVFQNTSELKLSSGIVNLGNGISVISYLPGVCEENCKLMLSNLQRVYDMRSAITDLTINVLSKDIIEPSSEFRDLGKAAWNVKVVAESDINNFSNAQALPFKHSLELYPDGRGLVLVDRKGYTRGYYDGADPDEVDRLMAEVKILNYEDKASANP
jgi:hypothetical protein